MNTGRLSEAEITDSDRRILAKAIFRLFDLWQLSEADQLILLGLPAEHLQALRSMRHSGILSTAEHMAERTRALLRIYRYLGMLYPEHPDLAKKWMISSHARLNAATPMDAIKNRGTAGINAVSALLEELLF